MTVKIRYKTDAKAGDTLRWRVLIDGVEAHASDVVIMCPSHTSRDEINAKGEIKWHITCVAEKVEWHDEKCLIQ